MTNLAKAASILFGLTSAVSARSTPSAFVSGAKAFQSTSLNAAPDQKLPVMAEESIMAPKAHGSSEKAVMKDLKWDCDYNTADKICNFNRHYAESAGYWSSTKYLEEVDRENPTKYYDSVTGLHLFTAPVGRTMEEYLVESGSHGWPSFRDEEVNWENVRCVPGGESVSITGTHLGHNIPDKSGNRYCINLVCIAGQPAEGEE